MILDKVNDIDFKGISNSAYLIGKITQEVCRGSHLGVEQVLVLVEDLRTHGKKCYSMVMLPSCESTEGLIKRKAVIFAEGILNTSYTFNNCEAKHIFLEPSIVKSIDIESDDLKRIEPSPEFYLNYTLYNRIVLEGEVFNDPKTQTVEDVGRSITKFKLKFKVGSGETKTTRTVFCVIWDTVNELSDIKRGDNIQIIASMNTTNNVVIDKGTNTINNVNSDKNAIDDNKDTLEDQPKEYTNYSLIVQKIIDLDNSPEKIARNIYI